MYTYFFENSDEILPIEFIKKSAHNTKTWKQSNMRSLSIFIISYSAIILVFSRNKASQTFSKISFLSLLEIVKERRRSEKRKKTKKSSQSQREKRFHLLLFFSLYV